MSLYRVRGYAYLLGDDIDTDVIIPGKYLAIKDVNELARHVLEPIDAKFSEKARRGLVIVAGKNFGMGSSREQAVVALKVAGVKAIIAESFSRIFYRNAINNALPVIECRDARSKITENSIIEIDLERNMIIANGQILSLDCKPIGEMALKIIRSGGLLKLLEKHR